MNSFWLFVRVVAPALPLLLGCGSDGAGSSGGTGGGGSSAGGGISAGTSGVAGASTGGSSSGGAGGGASTGGSATGGSSTGGSQSGGAGGVATSGAGGVGTHPACEGAVVYDGEPGSHAIGTSGLVTAPWPQAQTFSETNLNPAVGSTSLNMVLDPGGTCCGTFYNSWTNWGAGPGTPIDINASTGLQFWIKIDSGLYWNLQVELTDSNGTNSFTGADVHIADFIDGKNIDMTWRQANIPVEQFNTNGIDLSIIDGIVFEGDRAVTYDIDQVVFCGIAELIERNTPDVTTAAMYHRQ